VERAGRDVAFDTRKALAILAYLALTPGRQPRERLADLFWPSADPERARGALRRTLSSIRTSPIGSRLEADTSAAALETDAIFVDAVRFRELRAEGQHADAVKLYAGDFLAGFSLRDAPDFEQWQAQQAEKFRSDLAASLEALILEERGVGRLPRALALAKRWLELDRLNEAAHRELMRLEALSGDRAAAIRQYHECVHLLDRELGVAPLEETVTLYEAIRVGKLPAEATRARAPTPTRTVEEAVGDLYTLHGSYAKAVESYEAALASATSTARPALERKLAEVYQRRGD
jgi:DNA-binding SARP family transcriptional activator